MKVSLGMFTVYDAMQKDLADTIGRVARLGYDGIEMFGEIPCPAEELRCRVALSCAGNQPRN